VDLYRLEKIDEEFLMELEEILEQKNGIILVEWADKLEKFWPKDCLRLYFDYCQHGRTVQIEVKIDILKKLVSRWSDCLQNSKN
jgi:tRNA threonylcarbamoyladenosine biosynthesis protein TsaE